MFYHVAFCNGSADGTKFFEKGKSLEHIFTKLLLKLLEVHIILLTAQTSILEDIVS